MRGAYSLLFVAGPSQPQKCTTSRVSSETSSALNSVALAVGVFQMDRLKPKTWKIRMTRSGSWSEEQADEHLDSSLTDRRAWRESISV